MAARPGRSPEALAFASSTASDDLGAAPMRAVEATRQSLLRAGLEGCLAGALADADRTRSRPSCWRPSELAGLGAEAILLPSGTDGEYAALQIARRRAAERLVNIVVAPDETGSGVLEAARGCHFATETPRGAGGPQGRAAGRAGPATITVETVEIRAADGTPAALGAIDAEVVALAEQALAAGARCLVHLLDASKTGLAAPGRDALERLCARHPASESRCWSMPARCGSIWSACARDLGRGWMVLLTGSKFMIGPAFSGALLLPPRLAADLTGRDPLPAGFGQYFAGPEWPDGLARR